MWTDGLTDTEYSQQDDLLSLKHFWGLGEAKKGKLVKSSRWDIGIQIDKLQQENDFKKPSP